MCVLKLTLDEISPWDGWKVGDSMWRAYPIRTISPVGQGGKVSVNFFFVGGGEVGKGEENREGSRFG